MYTRACTQDLMRQQGWKIERVTKENRALELQNVELRKQAADVRAENLEVRCQAWQWCLRGKVWCAWLRGSARACACVRVPHKLFAALL